MVNLFLITGLPGTGKTTFARALAQRLGARHLNTDTVREEMGVRGQYDPQTKARVYRALQQQVTAALNRQEQVVVDGTFYRESLRASFAQLAENCGVRHQWIELRATEDCIRERVSRTRPDSDADFAVYQKIKAAYEPLQEPHLELWSDRPVEEMVEGVVGVID